MDDITKNNGEVDKEIEWAMREGVEETDKEVRRIMKDNMIDKEQAENVKEIMDEYDLDEDDAVELEEFL